MTVAPRPHLIVGSLVFVFQQPAARVDPRVQRVHVSGAGPRVQLALCVLCWCPGAGLGTVLVTSR